MERDISNEPVTKLELYRLVDQINKALADMADLMTEFLALKGEFVVGPTNIKRISRDAEGNIAAIEEYASMSANGTY